jgi:aminomethyltransferase
LNETILPEPLADPLQDIRINSGTARAYFVRAGEYIQIIDVAGRQCTDFQCFAARKLEKGVEHPLDVTTTRSLMGQSYPHPGLRSKAFDQDMEALVEEVRDTVGRHDAFGLACNARYYDDQGYPGHVNCTDNFNAELAPYGIAARKAGWRSTSSITRASMTRTCSTSTSRGRAPGDYVLLRALTDLVCVSSACPDDIDPSNGWNPTDIHVRTYSDKQRFSRGVAYRMTPDAEPQLTRETAFHPRFSALTRNYIDYRGYWLPKFSNAWTGRRILGLPRSGRRSWICRPCAIRGVTGPDA